MHRNKTSAGFAVALFATLSILACAAVPHDEGAPKIPIVLVGFGVFPTEDLSAFERLAAEVRDRYPGHPVRWAFTDTGMIEQFDRDDVVLFTEGDGGRNPEDVLAQLALEGHRRILMQPLAMLPSQATRDLAAVRRPDVDVAVGSPLVGDMDHIAPVVDALGPEIEPHAITIVAAPGYMDFPPGERLLVAVAEAVRAAYDKAIVMSVQGRPGVDRIEEAKFRARESGEVHIIPFTFLPRENSLTNRLFERQEDWRALIAYPRTTFSAPLIEWEGMREILIARIGEAL